MYTKAGLDSLMDVAVRDGFTDLLLAARPDTQAATWFSMTTAAVQSRRIGGLAVGQYFINAAHEHGLRAHAWLYTGWWGTYNGVNYSRSTSWNTAYLSDARCNSIEWMNWTQAGARKMVADFVADLLRSNAGLDGVHLDYMRVHSDQSRCPLISLDDVTAGLAAVRAVVPRDVELTTSISGSASRNALVKRDVPQWLGEGLVDEALVMSYTSVPMSEKLAYIAGLPEQWRIVPGVPSNATKAVLCAQVAQWRGAGFWDFGVFDSVTWTQGMAECFDN